LFGDLIKCPDYPQETMREIPLPGLLQLTHDLFERELYPRLNTAGFGDLRPGHGCVFGTITPEGERLTVLAERANLTKQAVGEVVSELERAGYVERVPDPSDGRAKIIRLTKRGTAAWEFGWSILNDVRERWEQRYGKERVATAVELLSEIVSNEIWAAPAARRAA
jgi:DNA-binding MarR family transcriptional regulator